MQIEDLLSSTIQPLQHKFESGLRGPGLVLIQQAEPMCLDLPSPIAVPIPYLPEATPEMVEFALPAGSCGRAGATGMGERACFGDVHATEAEPTDAVALTDLVHKLQHAFLTTSAESSNRIVEGLFRSPPGLTMSV